MTTTERPRQEGSPKLPDWERFADPYLTDYYGVDKEGKIPTDEQATLKFFVNQLNIGLTKLPKLTELAANRPRRRAIVVGTGPTTDDAFPLEEYVDSIDMADFSKNNRNKVDAWKKGEPGAPDWRPYIKEVLLYENNHEPSEDEITARENATRQKINQIMHVDARFEDPVGPQGREAYDIVVVPYCFDSATYNKDEWFEMMRHGASLVKPGGLFLVAALKECKYYIVGGEEYPAADVTPEDMEQAMAQNFPIQNTTMEVWNFPEHAHLGYTGNMAAYSRKPLAVAA